MSGLPEGPLLAYYGDDFTGSAAVMEVMSFAGLDSVLFLDLPSPERLAAFSDRRCIGIAGVARSRSPAWMAAHLPAVFAALAGLEAPLLHYKTCSTFDSAPDIGSIGAAIECAHAAIPTDYVPLIVGAPAIGRYQAFGNLFASGGGAVHRLDRHPTMARHPVTPMTEADVTRHLAAQTAMPIRLIDFVALHRGEGAARLEEAMRAQVPIVALDVLDEASLAAAGALVWSHRGRGRFAVGSQGVEYALVAHWRERGWLDRSPAPVHVSPVDRIAVVSGSCSPVTARQIAHAEGQGFAGIALDATRAVDPEAWEAELGRAAEAALARIGLGASPLLYTARGPDDPAVAALGAACAGAGRSTAEVNDRIGAGLGRLLAGIVDAGGLTRALIAGGDTSGHATLELGIDALSAIAAIAPGSPLCRAHAAERRRDGLELALKGGQIGGVDYFSAVRNGGPM